MCVLIVELDVVPGYPIVIGANRDESWSRPSAPPALADGGRRFAPTDLLAGGTWLGISRDGLLAALTNRSHERFDPARASRGELCRVALAAGSAAAAVRRVREAVARAPRNGFNLVVADGSEAFLLSGAAPPTLRCRPLAAGVHVITNLHEPGAPLLVALARLLVAPAAGRAGDHGAAPAAALDHACERLAAACRDHTDHDGYQVCKHGEQFGTVSSALVALSGSGALASRFLYADGPPCRTPYAAIGEPIAGWRTAGAGC